MPTHTLYAFPFSCSLAVHVALVHYDVPHALRWVQRGPGRQAESADLKRVNPKRKVPTLVLPSGEVLTEIERRRLIEWLAFTATELHKTVLAPAFDPAVSQEAREDTRQRLLPTVLAPLEAALAGRDTLLGGPAPTVADAYVTWGLLLLCTLWPDAVATPGLVAYRRRMVALPAFAAVVEQERAVGARA